MWPVIIVSVVLPAVGVDRYGDTLPPGATARLGTAHLRVGWVGGLHFAPDGKTFRGVTSEPAFAVWDALTGKKLRSVRWPGDWTTFPREANFSADGTVCVFQPEDGDWVMVVETATGAIRSTFRLPYPSARSCNRNPVSPDGRYVVSYDGDPWAGDGKPLNLLVWDTTTGRSRVIQRGGLKGDIGDAAIFAPDCRTVLVFAGPAMVCLDPATGRQLWTTPHGGNQPPQFSPDGKWILIESPRVILLDAATGKPSSRITFPSMVESPEWVAFSPDSRLLLWGDPMTHKQRGWNLTTGQEQPVPDELYPGDGQWTVGQWTVSRDGKWGVRQASQAFETWNLVTRKRLAGEDADRGHKHPIEVIDVSTDGKVATVNEIEERVRLWAAKDGLPLATIPLPDIFDVNAVRFTPDGRRLVVGYGHPALPLFGRGDEFALAVIDVVAARVERTIRYKWGFGDDRAGTVFGPFSVSPDGTQVRMTCCVTGRRNGNSFPWAVASWELATGRPLPARSLGFESADSTQLGAFSPDGRLICAGRHVLDAQTGRVIAALALKIDEGLARPVDFSADGRVVAAPVAEKGPPAHPQFTYGGRTNGDWLGVRVWDAATGRELARLPVPAYQAVRLAPDGRSVLALGSDLTVWDVATGKPVLTRSAGERHDAGFHDAPLAVSPDGRFAVTAPPDGTAHVWDIAPRR